jgi:uncharacterized protein YxjI
MDIAIRNKWISLRGSTVVKDLNENDIAFVKGKFWTVTSKKYVQDLNGNTKYVVRNKFWRLFRYSAFVYDSSEHEKVAVVKRRIFNFLHGKYYVKCEFGDMEITGNILGFDYHIVLNGKEVGHVSRMISLRDSFVLHIDDEEHFMFYLSLVIAIDNITDRIRSNNQRNSLLDVGV